MPFSPSLYLSWGAKGQLHVGIRLRKPDDFKRLVILGLFFLR